MARPKKEIDAHKVKRLAGAGLTVEEIASILECSDRTLYRRFGPTIEEGHTRMRASLKRRQYIAAMRGNTSMLIWLGKQYLGQRDKLATEITGADGQPFQVHFYLPDNGRDPATRAEPATAELEAPVEGDAALRLA